MAQAHGLDRFVDLLMPAWEEFLVSTPAEDTQIVHITTRKLHEAGNYTLLGVAKRIIVGRLSNSNRPDGAFSSCNIHIEQSRTIHFEMH